MRLVSSARIEVAEAAPYFLSTVGRIFYTPGPGQVSRTRPSRPTPPPSTDTDPTSDPTSDPTTAPDPTTTSSHGE